MKLCKTDSRTVKAVAARCPNKNFNDAIVYSELKYTCNHGGKNFKSKSKGDGPNQTTIKIGCPFLLKIKATKDGQSLEVPAFFNQHNHEVTELEYKFHPSVRKLDAETRKEVAGHLQLNAELQREDRKEYIDEGSAQHCHGFQDAIHY